MTATRPLALVAKVLLLLAAVECCVRTIFFNYYIVPHFVRRFSLLRERSGGANLSILFDVMHGAEPDRIRIAFLGDSTMVAIPGADETVVPYLVREELRKRFGQSRIDAVDASVIGLYASDGLLIADKLLGAGADVIVYGLLPRALPRHPVAVWTTRVSSELGPSDLSRLLVIGGGGWLARNFEAEQLIVGILGAGWKTYAYRSALKRCVSDTLVQRLPPLAVLTEPPPYPPQLWSFKSEPPEQFAWTYAEYGPPNPNWEALELLGRLCARYAPRRCLIFSGPLNPARRDDLCEPRLYAEYLARLQHLADQYGLVFRDYSEGMTPADFVVPAAPTKPDPMHLNAGGRAKLAAKLVDPIAAIVAAEIAEPAAVRTTGRRVEAVLADNSRFVGTTPFETPAETARAPQGERRIPSVASLDD